MTTHPQSSANAAGTPGRRYAPWWRRALGYLLRTVLPWSFLAQALGSIVAHDAWATGRTGDLIRLGAFAIVITLTALLARNGRSWSSRLLHMTVCRMDGAPASKATLLVRELATTLT
ncbi:hypothetical protein [uncultured Tessaracoccus sp.]|uniref:hypothetical protein n=1 Tax=uncultured Tessaracoccus sp. TaxID=905023 RepID=UPI0025D47500|nr:hypothetical protein [uncultured Tessaracoccus sp.]